MGGNPAEHCIGVSFLDEAMDFHVASAVRVGSKKRGSISASAFKETPCRDWVRVLPTPKVLRLDDEGCFRGHRLVNWIEEKGFQPMLIAGESLWQAAKHSRHLEVLKGNMSLKPRVGRYLLCLLLRKMKFTAPNQRAVGQHGNPVNLNSQGAQTFEERLQVTLNAREEFQKTRLQGSVGACQANRNY